MSQSRDDDDDVDDDGDGDDDDDGDDGSDGQLHAPPSLPLMMIAL